MRKALEEAWQEYQTDAMTDPMYRYSHDHKAIFRAGWFASQQRKTVSSDSVWITAPVAPDDDPE